QALLQPPRPSGMPPQGPRKRPEGFRTQSGRPGKHPERFRTHAEALRKRPDSLRRHAEPARGQSARPKHPIRGGNGPFESSSRHDDEGFRQDKCPHRGIGRARVGTATLDEPFPGARRGKRAPAAATRTPRHVSYAPAMADFQRPTGTRDFYPIELARRRWIENRWRRVSIRHGFEEVEGPVFEHVDLYKVKSGEGILSELFQA